MRKLMLVMLVAALAVPAMADVEISVVQNESDPCTANINYSCTGADASSGKALMAGLAIIVSVDAGDTITAVEPYLDGPSTSSKGGYGVFMKTAQIDMTDPCNPVWATGTSPVADPCDPGTVGGLGQYQLTLELGALFEDPCDDKIHAPGANGTLVTITIDDGDASKDSVVTLALEDIARGGIVMEGGGDPCSVTLTGTTMDWAGDCVKSDAPFYAEWVGAGKNWEKPDCWCYERHCRGDADGIKTGMYWVSTNDLTIFASGFNKGDLKLNQANICADLDHKKVGMYRCQTGDLTIFAAYFNKGPLKVPACPMDWEATYAYPLTSPPTPGTPDGDDDYNFWLVPTP